MTQELKTIRLYGKLGTKFGRVHRFAVQNASEAIRALCIMIPGFQKELITSKDRGIAYSIFLGKENINTDLLNAPTGGADIRIAPILQGAKQGGLFQVILGAALVIGAGFLTGGAAFAAIGAGGIAGAVATAGIGLALGGVVQMLSPQQTTQSSSASNGASYNFNGAVNTTTQGNCVPVLYGRMIVGSSVISAGIYSQDQ